MGHYIDIDINPTRTGIIGFLVSSGSQEKKTYHFLLFSFLTLNTPLKILNLLLLLAFIPHKQRLLRTPQLRIQTPLIDKLLMRTHLGDLAGFQDDDEIAVVHGAQTVRDEDGGALFFRENGVDVAEEGLLGVGV